MSLSEFDRGVLDIASRTYRSAGARERDIYDELGVLACRWAQRLRYLLDDPDAEAEYPSVVHRWRRVMESLQARRVGG